MLNDNSSSGIEYSHGDSVLHEFSPHTADVCVCVCISAAGPDVCVPNSASQHVYISLASAVKAQLRKYLSVHLSREIWSLNCKCSFPFETCSSPGCCGFLWFHTFRAKR